MSDRLNHRQRQFIRFYLLHGEATKAAIKAGYAPESARVHGSRLLKNPTITAELARRRRLIGCGKDERDATNADENGLPPTLQALPMSDRLNRRQRQFIRCYLSHGQITKAAIEAGYAPQSAHVQGSRLLKNPKVAAEIERRRRLVGRREIDRDAITAAAIAEELANIAFANMDDYLKIGEDGLLDVTNLTRRQAAALAEVTVTTVGTVRRVHIKLRDKCAALDRLAELIGLYDVHKGADES